MAAAAGLHYVTSRTRGIARVRRGRRFAYQAPGSVRVDRHLERIRKLAIPPAWADVWICADPRGHLQATGVDARGRLQYRYHEAWRPACDALKFRRVVALARELPSIRRTVGRHLAQAGLPRTRVLAAIVRLLESSLIRVGNEEYARDNGSFGLTTLRKQHVRFTAPDRVQFNFTGKSRVRHEIQVVAPRVAKVIRACRKLPGRNLFQYRAPDGSVRDVTAADVNAYLSELAQAAVTAKDFRTWGASVLLHRSLQQRPPPDSAREGARQVRAALEEVAGILGNTVAVCRKSYVHPVLLETYLRGKLPAAPAGQPVFGRYRLSRQEQATLAVLVAADAARVTRR